MQKIICFFLSSLRQPAQTITLYCQAFTNNDGALWTRHRIGTTFLWTTHTFKTSKVVCFISYVLITKIMLYQLRFDYKNHALSVTIWLQKSCFISYVLITKIMLYQLRFDYKYQCHGPLGTYAQVIVHAIALSERYLRYEPSRQKTNIVNSA